MTITRKKKLNALYLIGIVGGWIMSGIGFAEPITPVYIGEAMFLLGIPVMIFSCFMLYRNN
jgi:hypothetical protein